MHVTHCSVCICLAIMGLLVCSGCTNMKSKSDTYLIQNIGYGRYGPAIRIRNGTAEVVIVPGLSRVMHYGLVGEPNLLWLDPPQASLINSDEWIGIGGSRIWLWPESEWALRTGRAWPPMPTYDEPSEVTIEADGKTVVLRSRVHAAYGVRIVRSIRLEDQGSKLISSTKLVPEPGMKVIPASPWEICKVPPPEYGLARFWQQSAKDLGYKWLLREQDALAISQWEEGYLKITEARADHVGKIGMNGDLLAAKRGRTLFVQRNLTPQPADCEPYTRTQWYKTAKAGSVQSSEKCFVELEHTAPVRVPTKDTAALVVEWQILTLPSDEPTPHELQSRLVS